MGNPLGWISLVKMSGDFCCLFSKAGSHLHKLRPVHTAEMNCSPEFMGRYVTQGLSKAGANQYSFLKRLGAHNASGAILAAGNTNVHKPVSAFEELGN